MKASMRAAAWVLGLLLAFVAPAAAQTPIFDDPAGLVDYAYQPYRNAAPANWAAKPIYSPSLLALFKTEAARTAAGDAAALDFDPFVNGNDYQLTDLSITETATRNDKSLVAVSFTNSGAAQQLMFTLVRRVEGWKIDDIESVQPGLEWRLSEILAADPLLN